MRTLRTVHTIAFAAAALLAAVPAAWAQQGDTTRAAAAAARQDMLRSQLVRLRAEVELLRAELSRSGPDDAANARALRAMIESLEQSQRHLEEAIRGQQVLVRMRETRARPAEAGRAVEIGVQPTKAPSGVATARAFSASRVPAGYIGVTTETRFTARSTSGARQVSPRSELPVIVTVAPGSPAHRAGLAAGDTVLAINDRDGRTAIQELSRLLEPDRVIVFQVRRGTGTHRIPVRVEPRPMGTFSIVTTSGSDGIIVRDTVSAAGGWSTFRPAPAVGGYVVSTGPVETQVRAGAAGTGGSVSQVYVFRAPTAVAGARLEPLSRDLASKLGVPAGLLVLTVAPQTPSARAGIRAGDVLLGTGTTPLASLVQFQQAMEKSSARALEVKLLRDGDERVVTLRW